MQVKGYVDLGVLVESAGYLALRVLERDGQGTTVAGLGEASVYSWPEMFASTAGPFGGMGGAAMTEMQMYAVWYQHPLVVVYCNGRLLGVLLRRREANAGEEAEVAQAMQVIGERRTPRIDWSRYREASPFERLQAEESEIYLKVSQEVQKKRREEAKKAAKP